MKNSVCYEFKTLDNLLQRKIIKECKKNQDFIIPPIQTHILKYLVENKEIYQRDLEKKFKFRRSTALGILKTMEKNNLIVRNSSKENPRLKQISITESGVKNFELIKNSMLELEHSLTSGIDKKDLDVFFKVMEKIKENIREDV